MPRSCAVSIMRRGGDDGRRRPALAAGSAAAAASTMSSYGDAESMSVFFRNDPPASLDLPRPIFMTVVAARRREEHRRVPGPRPAGIEGRHRRRAGRRRHSRGVFRRRISSGLRHGAELAALYRAADAFVFPSRTDTFGLVMLEALASGTPVAAFPVEAPLGSASAPSGCGVLDEDLGKAAMRALAHAARPPAGPSGRPLRWRQAPCELPGTSPRRRGHANPSNVHGAPARIAAA